MDRRRTSIREWRHSASRARRQARRAAESRLVARNGNVLDVRLSTAALGAGGEIVVLVQDVTSERRQQAELHELAHRDHLTGLPNRRSLEERLARLDEPDHGDTWLLALDVDNFKSVNDLGGAHARRRDAP